MTSKKREPILKTGFGDTLHVHGDTASRVY